jgi:hypothetical protein
MKRTSATFDERSWSPSAAPMSMGPKADSADLQPVASEKSPIRPDHSHWLAGGYSQKLGGKFAQGFCDATVKEALLSDDPPFPPLGTGGEKVTLLSQFFAESWSIPRGNRIWRRRRIVPKPWAQGRSGEDIPRSRAGTARHSSEDRGGNSYRKTRMAGTHRTP